MKYRARLPFPAFLVGLSLLLPSGRTWAQAQDPGINYDQKQEVLGAITQIVENDAFVPNVDFKSWNGFLDKQRGDINKATSQGTFGAAVQKALNSFGFSHMYIMTPAMVETRQKHKVVGIGIMIGPDPKGIAVVRVFPGSPAEAEGLAPGDIILKVDGEKATSAAPIRGPEGSSVQIEVLHENGKLQRLTLLRRSYSTAEAASLQMADKETAVVRIPTFDVSYDPKLVADLMRQAQSSKNLVLDLRGNPGGAVVSMMQLLGMLIKPETSIGTFINAGNVKRYQLDHPGPVDIVKVAGQATSFLRTHEQSVPYYKGTIAVLINGGSGSAAEMAAAALHDQRGATVVGSKSAGAVLVSIIRDLKDGFKLQFPIDDYVTSGGVRLEGHGVVPDFTATDPRFPGRDPDLPLERAVAIIEKMDSQREALSSN